jgi:hypothetical protein
MRQLDAPNRDPGRVDLAFTAGRQGTCAALRRVVARTIRRTQDFMLNNRGYVGMMAVCRIGSISS